MLIEILATISLVASPILGIIILFILFGNKKRIKKLEVQNSIKIIEKLNTIESLLESLFRKDERTIDSLHDIPREVTKITASFDRSDDIIDSRYGTSRLFQTEKDTEDLICDRYNRAMRNNAAQNEFKNRHPELQQFRVNNYIERSYKPEAPPDPIFITDIPGEYLAIPIDNRYWVVFPKFDIVMEKSYFEAGAMKDVFVINNYSTSSNKRLKKIIRPALFENRSGNEWIMIKKGELDLDD